MKKPSPKNPPTKDGRVPALLRLRSETIRVMDDLAEDEKTSRVVMVQRALDEWIALKTEPA